MTQTIPPIPVYDPPNSYTWLEWFRQIRDTTNTLVTDVAAIEAGSGGSGGGSGVTLPAGTLTTVLHGNPSGDPTYSKVDLVYDISNVLPVIYGGTGSSTPFVLNAIPYVDSDSSLATSANLTFDSSTNRLGVGTASPDAVLNVASDITGAITSYATHVTSTVKSDVTQFAYGFRTDLNTEAAAFTLTSLVHNLAAQGTVGAGSTITNQYGFAAANNLTGATNNYGFYSDIASSANRWNFFSNGTANNAFNGNVRIGSTVAPTVALDVTGAALVSLDLSVTRNVGVGSTAVATSTLHVNKALSTTSSSVHGIYYDAAVTFSQNNSTIFSYRSNPSSTVGAFTGVSLVHYAAYNNTASGTPAAHYGFYVDDGLTNGTLIAGFSGNIVAAAGRWNFYAAGSANNAFAGFTRFGSVIAPTVPLDVTGAALISSTLGVTGAITNTTLTNGRVVLAGAAGLITDNSNLTFDGTTLATTGLNNSGNTVLGDASGDSLTTNFDTITVNSNILSTRTSGTVAAGVVESYKSVTTYTSDAGGTTDIRANALTTSNTGANNTTTQITLIKNNNNAGTGLIANLRGIQSSNNITSTGNVTSGAIVFGSWLLNNSGSVTGTASVFTASAPVTSSTGTIATSIGFLSGNMGTANVTTASGHLAQDITNATGTISGFHSQITSGTGKWNFLATGSANNAFKGSVRIGSTVAPTVALDVTGAIAATTTVSTGGYTVATLPAAGTAGRRSYVTDATLPTYGAALTGGGAVVIPVFDNGTIWISA